MQKKTISVVVPVYNEEECILSFLDESFFPVIKKIKDYKVDLELVFDWESWDAFQDTATPVPLSVFPPL